MAKILWRVHEHGKESWLMTTPADMPRSHVYAYAVKTAKNFRSLVRLGELKVEVMGGDG